MRWIVSPVLLTTVGGLACTPTGVAGPMTSATASATATASGGMSASESGTTTGDPSETEGEETVGTTGETAGDDPFPGLWPGETCVADDSPTPRVYFDLQAGDEVGRDFFRLPFPNDARLLAGGGIDLEGFPRPPPDLHPIYGAVVDRWLDDLGAAPAGFAVNGAVLFRSSHGIATLAGIHFLDITPGSPTYGEALRGLRLRAENGALSRNNYLCPDWLAVEPVDGVPLRPATTYAVLLTDALRPVGGGSFVADDDFTAMLGESPPASPAAAAAWPRYAPLRDFLASPANQSGPQLSPSSLVGGTVFTTENTLEPLVGADAVIAATPLVVSDLHRCDDGDPSPCASAPGLTAEEREKRRCGPPSPDFYEIHGRLRLANFQEGVAPYVSEGGGIAVDGAGPTIQGTIDACFALTIPKGAAAPPAGWPALLYADGTQGSFRGAILRGVAGSLAATGVATIAIEPVLHGERRGDSDDDGLVGGLDLNQLVFNVFNPDSARDTTLQGALDLLGVARFAREWTDDQLLEGSPITFDGDALAVMGHSLGANAGALALPFLSVRAAVLSGGGANLPQALLAKEEPQVQDPITAGWLTPREVLQAAFQERPDRPLTSVHPMVLLLNTYVNRSDADNTSRHLRREPLAGALAKHLLIYIGHVDGYSPLRAAGSLAIGAGVEVAPGSLFPPPCDGYKDEAARIACGWTTAGWLPAAALPAAGNLGGVTAVARMIPAAPGESGHSVAFLADEVARIAAFISDALTGEGPPVVP